MSLKSDTKIDVLICIAIVLIVMLPVAVLLEILL